MNQARILVVDDDERNVRLLESLLATAGYRTLNAIDGRQACRRVVEDRPDLVLLDAMMPQMNGFEVCRWIRLQEQTVLLPVVMVTALNATEEKVKALEFGADDFLSKPINRLELLAKVKSLLRVKSLQEDLACKNEQLRQAESLRKSLVQMIVHDLKNPLTGIQGTLELLTNNHLALNPDAQRLAGSIRRSCRSMLEMILNMLDVDRMEEVCNVVEATDLDLSDIIAGDVEECLGQAKAAHVELVSRCSAPGPRARADRGLVRRVIANLLNNALKHTPAGGRVVVEAREAGNEVEVRVTDTGEGIPPQEAERIFDKYARVNGQQGGTSQDRGLGLAFCRMAIEAHGGRISVESEPGRGSVFSFRIPAAMPAPAVVSSMPGERA